MKKLRLLVDLAHLAVTVVASEAAPVIFLVALVGALPEWDPITLVVAYATVAVGASFLGGTILGRRWTWRERTSLLTIILWVWAAATAELRSGGEWIDEGLFNAALFLQTLSMSIGLHVGATFMRPFEPRPA